MARAVRSNSRTPTRRSSRATARLTPDCVRPSDSAARTKLRASTTAARTSIPLSNLLSKAISVTPSHPLYDKHAFVSSNVQHHCDLVPHHGAFAIGAGNEHEPGWKTRRDSWWDIGNWSRNGQGGPAGERRRRGRIEPPHA